MTLTPEQFNKMATKEDLVNLASKDELQEMKNEILSAIDGLARNMNNVNSDRAANMAAHDRFEGRITVIEKKLELKPAGSY